MPCDVVGIAEIAAMAGVPRATVRQWRARGQLPEPCAELAMGPVWERAVIEAWVAARLGASATPPGP